MSKNKKKPRSKMDPKKFEVPYDAEKKKERDWTFEDIARSKTHRTW